MTAAPAQPADPRDKESQAFLARLHKISEASPSVLPSDLPTALPGLASSTSAPPAPRPTPAATLAQGPAPAGSSPTPASTAPLALASSPFSPKSLNGQWLETHNQIIRMQDSLLTAGAASAPAARLGLADNDDVEDVMLPFTESHTELPLFV